VLSLPLAILAMKAPGDGARRMVDSAALLVDEVLPAAPIRQWVLSAPFALRFLFASNPAAMGEALRYRSRQCRAVSFRISAVNRPASIRHR
jgi:hypothetical protein